MADQVFRTRVIGRPDYHDVLVNTAREAGVEINLDSEVDTIDFNNTKIRTKRGETFEADVIVGADGGLRSHAMTVYKDLLTFSKVSGLILETNY